MFPLEFRGEVNHHEAIVMGLSYSKSRHDRSLSHFDMIPGCDGQTTDLLVQRSAQQAMLTRCINSAIQEQAESVLHCDVSWNQKHLSTFMIA